MQNRSSEDRKEDKKREYEGGKRMGLHNHDKIMEIFHQKLQNFD